VQAECNRRLESILRLLYTHAERLRLSVYDGVAHEVTPPMWREAREWLAKWLVGQPTDADNGA
jgi:predicted esterase